MRKLRFSIIYIFIAIVSFSFVYADEISITSTHAGVYNADNMELLYGKNEQDKIAIASLTKLMTAVVSIENIPNLEDKITVDYDIISKTLDPELAVAGIYDGESLTYYDLLATMLIPSGADSAVFLSNVVFDSQEKFIENMNIKAQEIDMNNTRFSNVTGLDDENNYSTIEDVAKLLGYVLKNDTLKEIISMKSYTTTDGEITVSSTITRSAQRSGITLDYVLGGKTGTTGDAGICLASYTVDDDNTIISIVTGASMYSTIPYNIIDSEKLYKYIADKYSNQNVLSKGDKILELNTYCCKQDSVVFTLPEDIVKYVDNVESKDINIIYDGIDVLDSSMKIGTSLGKVKIYYKNELVGNVDIQLNEKLEFSLKKWIVIHKVLVGSIIAGIVLVIIIILIRNSIKNKKNKSY